MFVISFCVTALTCCTPCYKGEFQQIPEDAIEQSVMKAIHHPAFDPNKELPSAWWQLFDDEQLNHFIDISLASHPSLKKAEAQIVIAQAGLQRAYAGFFPTVGMNSAAQRFIISRTGIVAAAIDSGPKVPGFPRFPFTYTQYDLNMDFSYELDVWNKHKYDTFAACDELEAARGESALAELILSISLSNTYFGLQVNLARRDIAQQIIRIRTKELNLLRAQVENNMASELDLHARNIDLSSAQETILNIQQQIELSQNTLNSLLAGDFLQEVEQVPLKRWQCFTFPLPCDLPFNLLAHRPDVMVKMWKAEAAAYRIKVAETNFYPNINILSLFGFQTIHIDKWINGNSTYGFGGPTVRLPIFDGGSLKANLHTKEGDFSYAVEDYNETLLNAVKEVLNAITSIKKVFEKLQERRHIREDKEKIYQLTVALMENNFVSELDVLDTEKEWYEAYDNEMVMQGLYLQSILDLIRALGGGYE